METHKALSDNTPIFDKVVKCMKNMGNIDDFILGSDLIQYWV